MSATVAAWYQMHAAGGKRIDEVVMNADASRSLRRPAHLRVSVDTAVAMNTPLEQSSQRIDQQAAGRRRWRRPTAGTAAASDPQHAGLMAARGHTPAPAPFGTPAQGLEAAIGTLRQSRTDPGRNPNAPQARSPGATGSQGHCARATFSRSSKIAGPDHERDVLAVPVAVGARTAFCAVSGYCTNSASPGRTATCCGPD